MVTTGQTSEERARAVGSAEVVPSIGLTGLATMGRNLARNIARHGFPVVVHNRTAARTEEFLAELARAGHEPRSATIEGAADLDELIAELAPPRAVITMVKAGPPVDDVVAQLLARLDRGDIIVDAGNSDYRDTARRIAEAARSGVRYVGMGVSGGEEGALRGPSLMPGGDRSAYDALEPVLTAIAARADGHPCCRFLGPDGAGHYVKLVHNGIEYADMAMIAEVYDLLRQAGLDHDRIAGRFQAWNDGELESFLVEITARILRVRATTAGPQRLIDVVADHASQKGTGRITAQDALELGMPSTTIAEASLHRSLSALTAERRAAQAAHPEPAAPLPDAVVEDVTNALLAGRIIAYAQGFAQLGEASVSHGWGLDPIDVARVWRGGCIIRARLLDRVILAYTHDPQLTTLVAASGMADLLAETAPALRRVVGAAVTAGIPVPVLASALSYFDALRRPRLPAQLIQAQRDLFGAHTYQRTDEPGTYHSAWSPEEPGDHRVD